MALVSVLIAGLVGCGVLVTALIGFNLEFEQAITLYLIATMTTAIAVFAMLWFFRR